MYASHIVAAMDFALNNGAHVVLSAFGTHPAVSCLANETYPSCDTAWQQVFVDALDPLITAGVLVVTANINATKRYVHFFTP